MHPQFPGSSPSPPSTPHSPHRKSPASCSATHISSVASKQNAPASAPPARPLGSTKHAAPLPPCIASYTESDWTSSISALPHCRSSRTPQTTGADSSTAGGSSHDRRPPPHARYASTETSSATESTRTATPPRQTQDTSAPPA